MQVPPAETLLASLRPATIRPCGCSGWDEGDAVWLVYLPGGAELALFGLFFVSLRVTAGRAELVFGGSHGDVEAASVSL
jgi:hypothetical protein